MATKQELLNELREMMPKTPAAQEALDQLEEMAGDEEGSGPSPVEDDSMDMAVGEEEAPSIMQAEEGANDGEEEDEEPVDEYPTPPPRTKAAKKPSK